MNLNKSDIIIIGEIKTAKKVLFWFHGYGSNNWSFEPTMKMINMQMNDEICIVMPNAPLSDNKRSWYPLPVSNDDGSISENHMALEDAKNSINEFITNFCLEEEQEILIGGFSQGAALSLSMLFNPFHNYTGCIALSGYMPSADYYKDLNICKCRIFIAHGFADQAISFNDYKKTYEFLKTRTDLIHSYTDDFGHTVTKEVNNKIIEWLAN